MRVRVCFLCMLYIFCCKTVIFLSLCGHTEEQTHGFDSHMPVNAFNTELQGGMDSVVTVYLVAYLREHDGRLCRHQRSASGGLEYTSVLFSGC